MDETTVENARNFADAIAALLAPNAEVIVHDVGSETIQYIANNFSKRAIGDPSNLKEIDFSPDENVIGPYEKLNWNGRRIKSISLVMRSSEGRASALVCINMDLSQFDQARQVLSSLMSVQESKAKPANLFNEDWHEQINVFISQWAATQNSSVDRLTREQKKQLVLDLNEKKAFAAKHSVNYVARVIGLGRATIYNYLKET
ncbi:PAS domain-containing protein [Maritalea porphyrae]|jgi:predicted transcriptional regulator YheO|uniref:helix-turn-helix transcriptional regulator n=1 Tax=Maritalea porphyrae TaxID=880732 RepID=UPI0022AF4D4F|nr:PAS domain-containing protein [Maritalea porphyrae]MCZ4273125.1 PAS domain-containing protein [Maritalea porphyrae]